MSQIQQVCERINDTFVVKCIEQIQPEIYLGLEISDLISAIIAFFSVLAASFAGYAAWKANKLSESEAKAARRHNVLSVTPNVYLSTFIDSKACSVTFYISNNGLGPALIDEFIVSVNDKEFDRDKDVIEYLRATWIDIRGLKLHLLSRKKREFLEAGTKKELLSITFPIPPDLSGDVIINTLSDVKARINFKVKYMDLYENRMKDLKLRP
ncbi:hypothetical protein CMO91_00475 [Candidatus Woesearchaeota archaeon]|nr:hypothetical protein [Candidatus Woesearchaeota archaeon]